MSSKLRKNLKLASVSSHLVDAQYISSFFGISLNALYLRMHFDNFPKATKINGKLYFDLNEVLAHFKKSDEEDSYCFLVRDEIRTLIDSGRLSRKQVGQILNATNPSSIGGMVYLRNISRDRADQLIFGLTKMGIKLDFDNSISFAEQKKERLNYIYEVWDLLLRLVESVKISNREIGKFVNTKNFGYIGKSIITNAPSYKLSKIIKLKLIQNRLI